MLHENIDKIKTKADKVKAIKAQLRMRSDILKENTPETRELFKYSVKGIIHSKDVLQYNLESLIRKSTPAPCSNADHELYQACLMKPELLVATNILHYRELPNGSRDRRAPSEGVVYRVTTNKDSDDFYDDFYEVQYSKMTEKTLIPVEEFLTDLKLGELHILT